MRGMHQRWWRASECRRRLEALPLHTLQAASRLGNIPAAANTVGSQAGKMSNHRITIIGVSIGLMLVTSLMMTTNHYQRTTTKGINIVNKFNDTNTSTREAPQSSFAEDESSAVIILACVAGTLSLLVVIAGLARRRGRVAGLLRWMTQESWRSWRRLEETMASKGNFATLIKQSVFLSVLERAVLDTEQRLTGLYTLVFATVISYCLKYVNEMYTRQDWDPYVRIGGSSTPHPYSYSVSSSTIEEQQNLIGITSNINGNNNISQHSTAQMPRHLALSTTNILLEWTRLVTFITTVMFLGLMVGFQQTLTFYKPSFLYLILSTLYWVTSEPSCRQATKRFFLQYQEKRFKLFDSLEEWYLPMVQEIIQLLLVLCCTLRCLVTASHPNFRILAGLLCSRVHHVRLQRLRDILNAQLAALASFRSATVSELHQLDDRCTICLTQLASARVTSCNHYYHAECLLQVVRSTNIREPKCPICNAVLLP